jgi:hypothetical protein
VVTTVPGDMFTAMHVLIAGTRLIVIIGDKGSAAGVEAIADVLAEAAASEPVAFAYPKPLRAVAQTDGERVA